MPNNFDKYTQKAIKKFTAKRKLKKLRWLIISASIVIVGAATAFLITNGNVVGDISLSNSDFTYGESSLKPEAKVLFGSISSYEYYNPTTGEWSEEQPSVPGTYQVRAITTGLFGQKKTSDAVEFTIGAAPLTLTLSTSTINYGEYPSESMLSSSGLLTGDKIATVEYSLVSYTDEGANFKVSDITILDSENNNVTGLYTFEYPTQEFKLNKNSLRVTPSLETVTYDGNEVNGKVYDALAFDYLNSRTVKDNNASLFASDTNNQLFDGDVITSLEYVIKENGSAIENPSKVGKYTITITSVEIKHGDIDVTRFYTLSYSDVSFEILKREVEVVTESDEKTYDGMALSKTDGFKLSDSSLFNLLDGDSLVVDGDNYTTITNAGSVKNEITFKVVNSLGEDVTSNYSICLDAGILTVNKLHVTILPVAFDDKEYDGNAYSVFGDAVNNFTYGEGSKKFFDEDLFKANYELVDASGNKYTENPKDAAEYTLSISGLTAEAGLLDNYEIDYSATATFEISPRTVQIALKLDEGYSFGGTKVYDGNPVKVGNFTWSYKDGSKMFVDGDVLTIDKSITITNEYTNNVTGDVKTEITSTVKDAGHYTLSIDSSKFEINNGAVKLTNYVIELEDYTSISEMDITPVEITISPNAVSSFVFDGVGSTYIKNAGNYTLVKGEFVDSLNEIPTITVKFINENNEELDTAFNVGTYTMKIVDVIMPTGYRSTNYKFTCVDNIQFEITRRAVTIKPAVSYVSGYDSDTSLIIYDGRMHTYSALSNSFVYSGSNQFDATDSVKLSVIFKQSDIATDCFNAGSYVMVIDEDSLVFESGSIDNYEITFETENVTISKRDITIIPKEMDTTVYDSVEVSYPDEYSNYDYVSGSLKAVDALKLNVSFRNGAVTSSSVKNAATYTLVVDSYEFENSEVAANYNVTLGSAELTYTINPAKIVISPVYIDERVYDGNATDYDNEKYETISGQLYEDDKIEVNVEYYLNGVLLVSAPKDANEYQVGIQSYSLTSGISSNYEIEYSAKTDFEITKKEISISPIEIEEREYDGTAFSYDSAKYESDEELIGTDSITLNVSYYLENEKITSPVNAGTYLIKIDSVNLSGNENNYSFDYSATGEFTISKREIEVDLKDLSSGVYTYNGKSQKVYPDGANNYDKLSFGSLVGLDTLTIEVKYYQGQEEVDPVNAGTYTYKYTGYLINGEADQNYELNISSDDSFDFEISKLEVSIKPCTVSKEYDGKIYSYDYTDYKDPSKLNFEYAGTNEFLDGDYIVITGVEYNDDPINYGTYSIEVTEGAISFVAGRIGSTIDNYEITTVSNTTGLSITHPVVMFDLSDYLDNGWVYDGLEHVYDELKFAYSNADNVLKNENHKLVITVRFKNILNDALTDEIKNVGTYVLEYVNAVVCDENDDDVTSNYTLMPSITTHTVVITKRTVTINYLTNSIITKTYNAAEYEYSDEENNFTVAPDSLNNLVTGDIMTISVKFKDANDILSLTAVNASVYSLDLQSYNIVDDENNNVTSNYDIIVNPYTFKINPVKIQIGPKDASYIYSGQEYDYLTEMGGEFIYGEGSNTLIGDDELKVNCETTGFINAGSYTLSIPSPDEITFVTGLKSNYEITYSLTSTLTIERKEISISVKDYSSDVYTYNGATQKPYFIEENNYILEDGSLVSGEKLTINVTYALTKGANIDAGTYEYEIDLLNSYITGGQANLSNYNITVVTESGEYTINKKEVTVSVLNLSTNTYIYNGEIQKVYSTGTDNYILEEGSFAEGESFTMGIKYDAGVEQKNVGSYYYYYDSENNSVSGNRADVNNYDITIKHSEGTYSISKQSVTISLIDLSGNEYIYNGAVQKPYDGSYTIASGTFAEGERLYCAVKYLIDPMNVGLYQYSFDVSASYIILSNGENMNTSNYAITCDEVKSFTISKYVITIKPGNVTSVYSSDAYNYNYNNDLNNNFEYVGTNKLFNDDKITLKVTFTDSVGTAVNPVNVGTYNIIYDEIVFSGNSIDNYDVRHENLTDGLEILKKEVKFTYLYTLTGWEYDGNYHSYTSTDVSYPYEDYMLANINHKITMSVSFKNNITGDIAASIKDKGTYALSYEADSAKVYDASDNDITYNYKLTFIEETKLVTIGDLTIYIKPVNKTFEYDSTEYTYLPSDWEYTNLIESTNKLLDPANETLTVEVIYYTLNADGTYTPVSEHKSAGTYYVGITAYNISNNEVNYVVNTTEYGVLTVNKREISVNMLQVADYTFLDNGNDSIRPYSASSENYSLVSIKDLVEGEHLTLSVRYYDSLGNETNPFNAGTYTYKYDSYKIVNNSGEDLSDNYIVNVNNASGLSYKINPKTITVTINEIGSATYNSLDQIPSPTITYSEMAEGDSISVSFIYNRNGNDETPNYAGDYKVTMTGLTFTGSIMDNYVFDYTYIGSYTIYPYAVTIKPIADTVVYNGLTYDYLTAKSYGFDYVGSNKFFNDDTITVTGISYDSTPLNAGSYFMTISSYNFTGTAATNYAIDYATSSSLVIEKRAVTVNLNKIDDRTYDKSVTSYATLPNNFTYDENTLYEVADNQTLTLTVNFKYNETEYANVTDAHKYTLVATGVIMDASSNDVTSNYDLTINTYEFTIYPARVAVPEADDTYYEYNGLVQKYILATNDEIYSFGGDSVNETNAGTYSITLSLKDTVNYVWDEESDSVDPKTYTFEIHKRPVSIAPVSGSKTYDGVLYVYNDSYGNFSYTEGSKEFVGTDNTKVIIYVSFKNGTVSEPKNAGTYTMSVTTYNVSDELINNNYDIDYSATSEYVINRIKLTLKVWDLSSITYTYNGKVQHPCDIASNYTLLDGVLSTGEVLTLGIDYEDDCKNVGTYKYTYNPENNIISGANNLVENYEIECSVTEGSFTISPSAVTIEFNKLSDKVYDSLSYAPEDASFYTLSGGNIADGEIITITAAIYDSLNNRVYSALNADTYTVKLDSYNVKDAEGNAVNNNNYVITCADYAFTISKRDLTIKLNAIASVIYDGLDRSIDASKSYYLIGELQGEDELTIELAYTYGGMEYTPVDARVYNVSIKNVMISGNGINNYNVDSSSATTYEIEKRVVTVKPLDTERTYDGTVYDYIADKSGKYEYVSDSALDHFVGTDTLTITEVSYTNNDSKNAGAKSVTVTNYTFTGNENNYEVIFNTGILTVNKREVSVELYEFISKAYDGVSYTYATAANNFNYKADSLLMVDGEVLSFTVLFDRTAPNGTLSADSEAVNVGSYSLDYSWSISGGLLSNYIIDVDTEDFEITYQLVDIPAEDKTVYIYNKSEQTYIVPDSTKYTVLGNKQTNAKEDGYDVTIKLANENYAWSDTTETYKHTDDLVYNFIIYKAEVTIPAADETVFTYNGSEQTYALTENELYTITNNKQINAGEYTVTAKINDYTNYKFTDTKETEEYSFVINRLTVTVPLADENNPYTYTGEFFTYSIPSNSAYTITGATEKNVGNYIVTVSLNNSPYANYIWSDSTDTDKYYSFVINKAKVTIPEADDTVYTYDGTPKTYKLTKNDAIYTVYNDVKTNANKTGYTVTVSLNDPANYEWTDNSTADKEYTFIINKLQVHQPERGTTSRDYDGTTWTYVPTEVLTGESGYYTITDNSQIFAGTYSATIALNDSANYEWIDGTTSSLSYDYTINKIKIKITVKAPFYTGLIYNGIAQYPFDLSGDQLVNTSIDISNKASTDSIFDYSYSILDKESGDTTPINAGTYTYTLDKTTIIFYSTAAGATFNLTDNYELDADSTFENEFTIGKLAITLNTNENGMTYTYDGNSKSGEVYGLYEILPADYSIKYRESIYVSYVFQNADTYENVESTDVKEIGKYNYFINLNGAYVYPYDNSNVNRYPNIDNFDITVKRTSNCFIKIDKIKVTIAPCSSEIEYTGSAYEYKYQAYDSAMDQYINWVIKTCEGSLSSATTIKLLPEKFKYLLDDVTETNPVNAGTYTIYADDSCYTIEGDYKDYIEVTVASGTLTITPKSIDFPFAANDKDKDFKLEYTGSSQDFILGDEYGRYELRKGETDYSTPDYYGTDMGIYSAYIVLDSNYKWSNGYANERDCSYEIIKRTLTVTYGTISKTYDGTAFTLAEILNGSKVEGLVNGDTTDDLVFEGLPANTDVISKATLNLTISGYPSYYDLVTKSGTFTINKKEIIIKPIEYDSKSYDGEEYADYDAILLSKYPTLAADNINYIQTGEFIETTDDYIIAYEIKDILNNVIVKYDGTNVTKPYDSKNPWSRGTYTISVVDIINASTKESMVFSSNYSIKKQSTTFTIGDAILNLTKKTLTYDGITKTPLDFFETPTFNGLTVHIYGLKINDADSVFDAGTYTVDFSGATYYVVSKYDASETLFDFDVVKVDSTAITNSVSVSYKTATLTVQVSRISKEYDTKGYVFNTSYIRNWTDSSTIKPMDVYSLKEGQGLQGTDYIVESSLQFTSNSADSGYSFSDAGYISFSIDSSSISILRYDGATTVNVAQNYNIKTVSNRLEIKKRTITVQTLTENLTVEYDGQYHKGITDLKILDGSLLPNDSLVYDSDYEGYYLAGTYKYAKCAMIVGDSDNYSISYDTTYSITITKKVLYIDWSDTSNPKMTNNVSGDELNMDSTKCTGTFGSGLTTFDNVKFTVSIINASGTSVRSCYDIYYIYNGYMYSVTTKTTTKITS